MRALATFGVQRPVVANLVMFAVIGAGLVFGLGLRREFFPEIEARHVVVLAPYPGAAPEEVEQALAIKIEDAVEDIDGVKEVSSTVTEGLAAFTIEFFEGTDINTAVTDVKREIDALQDLPAAADRITVDKLEPNLPAIALSIYGDADERTLKRAIRQIESDLRSLPGMGTVAVSGVRTDELSVEVEPALLLAHRLSLPLIADRIGEAMLELPGGSVRGSTSNVAVRTLGVEERASAVRNIVVSATPGGEVLRLGDIATVRDAFVDQDLYSRLNGEPAVSITVFKEGKEDIIEMAEMVKAYVAGRNGETLEPTLGERFTLMSLRSQERQRRRAAEKARAGAAGPPGPAPAEAGAAESLDTPDLLRRVSPRFAAWVLGRSRADTPPPGTLTTTTDLSRFVTGRLELLTRNALQGGALVFLTLIVFLNWRVAFWVTLGLVVSLLGTLTVMYFTDTTLNLMTMFGLIIVVGILVDDAIVVAENIQTVHERGVPAGRAAIEGAAQVGWPVVATVLTTVFAFVPLALIEGQIGDFLRVLPLVVACALGVSLIESLFILPPHMAHSLRSADRERESGRNTLLRRVDLAADRWRVWLFEKTIAPAYARFLSAALRLRYVCAAAATALIVLSVGLVAGKRVPFTFFETEDAETVDVQVEMPVGTPIEATDAAVRRIERIAIAQPEVVSAYAIVGATSSLDGSSTGASGTNQGQLILELMPVEQREARGLRSSARLTEDIRAELGVLPGVDSLRIEGVSGGPGGASFTYAVAGDDLGEIMRVAEAIKTRLADFEGVRDIADDADLGQRELRVALRPGAEELGFTRAGLGRQVQGFAFGLEAFTFAGDEEDVDVRVRLPERVRRSLAAIEAQHVLAPAGQPVPLREVAEITEGTSYATIRRLDGRRIVTVEAYADEAVANTEQVAAELEPFLDRLRAEHPGVRILARGRQEDVAESFATLPIGMAAAAGLIYVTLAWLFGSFVQPLIVMTAIPFAIIGMVFGHLVMGYDLTFLSLIGFVALSGIVVNDSLIFMEFFNHERAPDEHGRPRTSVYQAAINAGRARVRAILLTTITTVLGLTPLLMEQSFQARFLIPMAITIVFGLISATALVLIVLPCLLVIFADLKRLALIVWTARADAGEDPLGGVAPPTLGLRSPDRD